MLGLSAALYKRCHDTLLRCSEFDSDASVRAVFVTGDLYPFKIGLPGANNKLARVTAVLEYLLEQEPDAGPPVFVLFLRALSGHYKRGNALLNELEARAREVEEEWGRSAAAGLEKSAPDVDIPANSQSPKLADILKIEPENQGKPHQPMGGAQWFSRLAIEGRQHLHGCEAEICVIKELNGPYDCAGEDLPQFTASRLSWARGQGLFGPISLSQGRTVYLDLAWRAHCDPPILEDELRVASSLDVAKRDTKSSEWGVRQDFIRLRPGYYLFTIRIFAEGYYWVEDTYRLHWPGAGQESGIRLTRIGGRQDPKDQSAPAAANPLPELAVPGVTVTLLTEVLPTAYCYQLTSEKFPLVNVTLDNTGRGGANATMRIQAVIEGFSDLTIATPQVPQGTQSRIALLPLLRKEAVAALNEMRPTTLHVTVEQTAPAACLLHEQTYPIRLHARDTALLAVQGADGGIVDLSDYLAAWVTPRSPVMEQWLRRAAEQHPGKSMVGYQGASTLPQGAAVVRAQAQAIFTALKQEANLTYINSPLNMGQQAGQVTQRVRLPSESLAAGGSANCIDGTVLFASLLELASLEPLLMIVPGHAFVGWRIWRGVNQYEFLETTMIGSAEFVAAQQIGQQEYDDALAKGYFTRGLFDPGGFARLVDIAACRAKGILPLE